MLRHSIGTLAVGVFLAMFGMVPTAAAQSIDTGNVQELRPIRIPVPPDRAVKPALAGDFRRLEMGREREKLPRIQIGPVEIEKRSTQSNTPWQPEVPYFLRPHVALSLSFDLRLKDR